MRRAVIASAVGLLTLGLTGNAGASHTGWVFGAGGPRITVTMTEYAFAPATLTFEAGTPVDVILENKGTISHVFMVYSKPATPPKGAREWWEYVMARTYFQDLGEVMVHVRNEFVVAGTRLSEVAVEPGKRVTLTFVPARKGTFEIGCHLSTAGASHYTAGMRGTFTVK